MTTKALFAAALCAVASFCANAAAIVENRWINRDGGKWNDSANWSLGYVPKVEERAHFPDIDGSSYTVTIDENIEVGGIYIEDRKSGSPSVTFAGGGTLTAKALMENYSRRKLILDNVTLVLDRHYIMVYAAIEVKAKATLINNYDTRLWRGTPSITVEQGGKVVAKLVKNFLESSITVNGGEFSCSNIAKGADDSVNPINVTVNGGSFSVGNAEFCNLPTLAMNDGIFKVESNATFPDGATFNFTGGTLVLPALNPPPELVANKGGAEIEYVNNESTTTDSTILENLNGETLVVNSSSDYALNLWPFNGYDSNGIKYPGKEVNVNGSLVVTNGYVNFSYEGYFYGDYPIFAKGFKIQHTDATRQPYGTPTIGFPEIIIGKDYPFVSKDSKTDGFSGIYTKFYIDGPTTFRATADVDAPSGIETFLMMSGDCTVDTANYYDSSVSHKVYLYGLCAKSQCALAVRGGGELVLKQAHAGAPFTRVEVAEGTTLTLANLGQDCNYGPLHTDELVLGPNSVLNIPAGFNSVRAGEWTVDPTARVNVMFSDGLATDAIGLMYGGSDNYRIPESQITVTDASAKWSLAPGDACWIATNSLANLASLDGFEWTGNGGDYLIGTLDNWYCRKRPMETNTYVFGAANAKTEMKFYRVYRNDTDEEPEGSTVKAFNFRNTATTSFRIYNSQPTLNNGGEYSAAGVFSESTVPQYIESSLRVQKIHSLCAASEGPLVFTPYSLNFLTAYINDDVWMRLVGDIRFGATITAARLDFGARQDTYANRSPGSRLTILTGGNITYTNQHQNITQPYTGFHIQAGGMLTFTNGSGKSIFKWKNSCSANHTVNGTLNVKVPYLGGGDQSFSGTGTINLTSIAPNSAASSLSFGGNLTVNLPGEWPTITATATNLPLTLKVYGSPTIHTAGNWTYGVFEEIANPAIPKKRAAKITKDSTLTFNPDGGTVTFKDPLSGKGTVAIGDGTLYIPGGVAPSIGVKILSGGTYKYDAAHELRSLVCEEDSTLLFAAPITVKERVNLGNMSLEWAEGAAPGRSKAWTTIFVSKTGFGGELASLDSKYYYRISETANGFEYQVRPKIGAVVTFR